MAQCGTAGSGEGDAGAGRFPAASPCDGNSGREGGPRPTEEEPVGVGELGDCLIGNDFGFDTAELGVSCPSRDRALRLALHEYSLDIV